MCNKVTFDTSRADVSDHHRPDVEKQWSEGPRALSFRSLGSSQVTTEVLFFSHKESYSYKLLLT